MSLYYKQEFKSPVGIFSEVKEVLNSYFNSGAIDDVLFPKWLEHCLRRFRKSSFKIEEAVIPVSCNEACLPKDFNSVREVWMCTTEWSDPYKSPSSYYYQTDCRIEPQRDSCEPCFDENNNECCDTRYLVTHKVNNTYLFSFSRTFLLRPGNMNASSHCGENCKNMYADSPFTFDIANGKMITNFAEGTIHLIYYAEPSDEIQMIPDNFFVEDYIRKYLIYMCFQQLSYQITDETFNQIQLKLQQADQAQAMAFILAENDLKGQTSEEKIRQIGVSYRRFNKYRIR